MPIQNYIGINGLVTQDLDAIIEDLKAKLKTIYGDDINLEQNSPDGQFVNIFALQKKDALDLLTQYYNNLDPDRVVGIPQQILYKLNGLIIKAYTYSYVYVNVTNTEPITLQGLDDDLEKEDGTGYTVIDINGNRWILTDTAVLGEPGTHLLNFRAADLGEVTCLPNTINVMETILKGISGVNNPANNYITGNKGESSAEFRTRRNKAMSVPSQGFDESIRSQLLNLDNVTQALVYDNKDNEEAQGIPPHTVWVIVEGGDPNEIGRVIYNNIPPGIPMKGEQVVEIEKSSGEIVTVEYDLPTAVPLYIKATLVNFGSATLDLDYIKQQLAELSFEIAERADNATITTEIKNIIGQDSTVYDVILSLNGQDYEEYVSPTGLDQYFSISVENIDLTVK